jgi:hypothetical protein
LGSCVEGRLVLCLKLSNLLVGRHREFVHKSWLMWLHCCSLMRAGIVSLSETKSAK